MAAIPEIVKNDEGGFIVPAGSVTDLKAAILRLAKDDTKRKAMGEAAFNLTKKQFDAKTNALQLFDLLKLAAQK